MHRSVVVALFLMLVSAVGHAHEMTPTYPVFKSSFMSGLLKTDMEIFNKRKDVAYYEIGVFDKDFQPIPFVSNYNVYKVDYLKKVQIEIFIRQKDEAKVTYICSRSRVLEQKVSNTSVASTICSKVKGK